MDDEGSEPSAVDGALLEYLDDVNDYVDRLREEASRALTRAVRQAADFGWSQRKIAAAVGRSQPEVARLLRATRPRVEYAFAMPESAVPETARPETARPETARPETARPETAVPETARPESTVPETAEPATAPPAARVPSTLTWVLRDKREEIVRIAAANGASNVRVFGSVARGEDDVESDVDLLVDVAQETSLWDLGSLTVDLERLLDRRVDVVEAAALWPRIARKAIPEAVAL
ncbi:nucleotidyltransferase domain-containing protein [Cellulomonas sp. RIT-PI-Y]|uniref:nucleotidyltransferase family protein n=1 Tax=Cellulomonas sp. RIT-PI-Y TaxID=3035297 RepID=UPI0021D8D2B1|nr:nucleotidyltransferase domain-containing protein [Cellulomonas sp. RIT-PI-Y]